MRSENALIGVLLLAACSDHLPLAPRAPAVTTGSAFAVTASASVDLIVGNNGVGRDVNSAGVVVGHGPVVFRFPPFGSLPNPAGDSHLTAAGINDAGAMIGVGVPVSTGVTSGFFMTANGSAIWVPQSVPQDLNNAGEIVGRWTDPQTQLLQAVVWPAPSAPPIVLGTLPGGNGQAFPRGIASGLAGPQRVIAGLAGNASGGTSAVYWVGTQIFPLQLIAGATPSGGRAEDAADNGMVVGSLPTNAGSVPIVWQHGNVYANLAPVCGALTGFPSGAAEGIAIMGTGQILIAGWCLSGVYAAPVVFYSLPTGGFGGELLPAPAGTVPLGVARRVSATGWLTGEVASAADSAGVAVRWQFTPPPLTGADLALGLGNEVERGRIRLLVGESNFGPASSGGATLVVKAPVGIKLVRTQGGSCASDVGPTGVTLTCNRPALRSGATRNMVIILTPPGSGTYTFNATLTGVTPDPNLTNNAGSTLAVKP
jgi:hypothetical protein